MLIDNEIIDDYLKKLWEQKHLTEIVRSENLSLCFRPLVKDTFSADLKRQIKLQFKKNKAKSIFMVQRKQKV